MTPAGSALALGDAALLRGIQRRAPHWTDHVFPPLSRAAGRGVVWFAFAGALALSGADNRAAALRGIASWTAASALANGPAKMVAERRRPARLRNQPSSSSFPSGHSAAGAAFATGVILERPALGVTAALLAGAVAYSRVHTGAHYPGDVVAGVALGVLSAGTLALVWKPATIERRPATEVSAGSSSPPN